MSEDDRIKQVPVEDDQGDLDYVSEDHQVDQAPVDVQVAQNSVSEGRSGGRPGSCGRSGRPGSCGRSYSLSLRKQGA